MTTNHLIGFALIAAYLCALYAGFEFFGREPRD